MICAYKRRDKKENTSRSSRFNKPELIKSKPINSNKLNHFKTKLKKEQLLKKRKELIFSVLLIIGAVIVSILMIMWAIGKY